MERISNRCKPSETNSNDEGNSLHGEKVKRHSDNETAINTQKANKSQRSSCQTEIADILGKQLLVAKFEDELEQERQVLEKESSEEKGRFEIRLGNDYNEIIKAKEEVIQVLTEEKDFFRSELHDLRKSFDLFTRHVHRDAIRQLRREREKDLGTKLIHTGNEPCCCHNNPVWDNLELLTVLRKQEEILLGSFEREKAAMTMRFEREKTALREVVEEECEEKYAFERAYLLQSIEGLKEGLDSLRIQKDELAKIFEGEKNALELSFKRKEDELRQNLKLELQQQLIKAQKPWARTKI